MTQIHTNTHKMDSNAGRLRHKGTCDDSTPKAAHKQTILQADARVARSIACN
jgi:hypothetical protein